MCCKFTFSHLGAIFKPVLDIFSSVGLLNGRKGMGPRVHDMSLHEMNHKGTLWSHEWFRKIIIFWMFISVHRLVLIRDSLCACSQRARSIRLKLLCVCGMIFAFIWAAVPHRSPSLCWRQQSHTSFSSFAPPHILHREGGGSWEWTQASGLNSVIAFSGCRQLWYVIHK